MKTANNTLSKDVNKLEVSLELECSSNAELKAEIIKTKEEYSNVNKN